MGKTITCKQAVDYISKKEDGKLSAAQRFRLWQHLAICSICRIFYQQNKIIRAAFANQPAEGELSSHDKEQIIQSVLENEQDGSSLEKK
jgi:predicted anti-sigma-YlaC factor YlaD